jgi:BolA family transcriptional regulator, general stress-responsive regulator
MTYAERIRTKLTEELNPTLLEIDDESHRHAGHLQHDGGAGQEGETHFSVHIIAAAFTGKSRVARQRMVYAILADELSERVHALTLRTQSPDEVVLK